MASLTHISSGTKYVLTAETRIGRASSCAVPLTSPLSSGQHAVLRWNGSTWTLHDLGSSNGTFLNRKRLPSGARMEITCGARIAFGDDSDEFTLEDASGPRAMAVAEGREPLFAEGGMLVLPSATHPDMTIFSHDGATWIAETRDGRRRPVRDGDSVQVAETLWQLSLPTLLDTTLKPDDTRWHLHGLTIRFLVAPDEETVSLELIRPGQTMSLPHRVYWYLLLTLARARLEDQKNPALPESEHGWIYIPDLLRMLHTNENQNNVAIFRARKQFAKANINGAPSLFERRPHKKEIRIGVSELEVGR